MTNETNAKSAPETKKRANSVYTYAVLDGKPTWDYGTVGKFSVDPDKMSATARAFLMMYGIKQWVNDGGAVEAGTDGKVSAVDKFNGSRERAELLNLGTESSGLLRRGGGSGAFSYVTRALVRLGTYAGQDVSTHDKANAYVASLATSENPKIVALGFKGQVAKVRAWLEKNSKAIAKAIDDIKAEELANVEAVDADDLLEELGD